MAAGGVSPLACWRGSTGCTAGRSTRLSAFRPDPVPMASNSSLDQWRLHYFLGTSQDQTHRKGLHSVRFPEPYNPDTDPWHEDDEALPEPGYPGKLPGGPQMQTAARSSKPTGQWDPSWADPPPWAITQEVAADFIAQSATHQAQPYMQHNQPTPSKPEPASQHAATTHRDHTDDNTETGAGQPQQLSSDPHQAVQAAAPPTQEAAPAMDNNTGGAEQAPNNQASDQPTFDQGQHTNPSKVEPQTQQPPQEPVQETEQPESGNTAGWRQPRTNSITSAAIGRGAHPLKAKEDRGGGCFTDLRFPPTQRPQQQHPAAAAAHHSWSGEQKPTTRPGSALLASSTNTYCLATPLQAGDRPRHSKAATSPLTQAQRPARLPKQLPRTTPKAHRALMATGSPPRPQHRRNHTQQQGLRRTPTATAPRTLQRREPYKQKANQEGTF